MKKGKEKEKSFLSTLFEDDDFKVNDKIFEDDDDTTFNEIKDRTEELTNEIIEEAKSKEEANKEEIAIASSFPKLDRLGSVVPHKVK